MIHWLAGAYAKKGVTVNGVAPALIMDTNMIPGPNGVLENSKCTLHMICSSQSTPWLAVVLNKL